MPYERPLPLWLSTAPPPICYRVGSPPVVSHQTPFTLDVTTGRGIAIHRMGHTVGLLRGDP